jgi:hypothetical protein
MNMFWKGSVTTLIPPAMGLMMAPMGRMTLCNIELPMPNMELIMPWPAPAPVSAAARLAATTQKRMRKRIL